jgi:hypothetical protein
MKLLDQARNVIRFGNRSIRTEKTQVNWIRRFIVTAIHLYSSSISTPASSPAARHRVAQPGWIEPLDRLRVYTILMTPTLSAMLVKALKLAEICCWVSVTLNRTRV